MSTEALTRQNRYERYGQLVTETVIGRGLATAGVLRCRSCGSLLAEGDEDLHERLHPRVPCAQMGHDLMHGVSIPGGVTDPAPHAWEEQFPDGSLEGGTVSIPSR